VISEQHAYLSDSTIAITVVVQDLYL